MMHKVSTASADALNTPRPPAADTPPEEVTTFRFVALPFNRTRNQVPELEHSYRGCFTCGKWVGRARSRS